MNALNNGDVACGAPNSIVRERDLLRCALKEIVKNKGMCIYGCPEMLDAPTEELMAFRLGSAKAFNQMVDLAERALLGEDVGEP